MALGDGIRRNIADVEPTERALLRDAFIELNRRRFPGERNDSIPGGVTFWFKQDEIHKATHVHRGLKFIPWHRELINRLERMLREVDNRLSLHYWDWTEDPRAIPGANLGNGTTGTLNLFTPDFMGYGGIDMDDIGEPWLNAGFYDPTVNPGREITGNPFDTPTNVQRRVGLDVLEPVPDAADEELLAIEEYPSFSGRMVTLHNDMHSFVQMGGAHISFRDPFVFLLHSNVDRLFAMWQTDPTKLERLNAATVYGDGDSELNGNLIPWSGEADESLVRPWTQPDNLQEIKDYKDPSIILPPVYDTTLPRLRRRISTPEAISFGKVAQRDIRVRNLRIRNSGSLFARVRIEASLPPPEGQPLSGFAWNSFTAGILPGDTVNHIVSFSPRGEGRFDGRLTVRVRNSSITRNVALRGEGLPANVPVP